jgi:tetratricopeptide (TPR) repeat protein
MTAPTRQSNWQELLERARYQATQLRNIELARSLCKEASAAGPEASLHARRFAVWLDRPRDTQTIDDSGDLPSCGIMLVDETSMQAFYARVCRQTDGSAVQTLLGSRASGLDAAKIAALRLLARKSGIVTTRLTEHGLYVSGPAVLEEKPIAGRSLSAAAALVLYAHFCGAKIPEQLIVCAAIDEAGRLHETGHQALKLEAAQRERPEATVVTADQAPTLEALASQHLSLGQTSSPKAAPLDIEATVRFAVDLYEKRAEFAWAAELFALALDAIRADARDERRWTREAFTAHWRRGSALIHLGRFDEARAALEAARSLGEQLWQKEEIDAERYLGMRGNYAVLLRDRLAYAQAEALLEQSLALQRALRVDKRQRARTLGNLGELSSFMGKHQAAKERLTLARDYLASTYPDELPRAYCNLGNAALRRGDLEAAFAHYQEGIALNRRVDCNAAANEPFLHYGQARAWLYRGEAKAAFDCACEAAQRLPDTQTHPRLLLLTCAGVAALANRDSARGRQLLQRVCQKEQPAGLLHFGLHTAIAHLLLFESLTERGLSDAQQLLLEQLIAAVLAFCCFERGPALVSVLRATQTARFFSAASRRALREICAAFPYGVEAIF